LTGLPLPALIRAPIVVATGGVRECRHRDRSGANHDLTAGNLVLTRHQEDAVVDVFYDCVDLSTAHFASCFGSDAEHSDEFRDFITGELLGTNQESEIAARVSRLIGVSCLGGQ
jgi:hypothetical protein